MLMQRPVIIMVELVSTSDNQLIVKNKNGVKFRILKRYCETNWFWVVFADETGKELPVGYHKTDTLLSVLMGDLGILLERYKIQVVVE